MTHRHQHGHDSHDHSHEECCHCHKETNATHFQEEKDFARQLLDMADDAWMEVLKDKIKEQILKDNEKNLEELAKLVSESNHKRWKHKLQTNKINNDYKDKVTEFFERE